MKKLIMLALGVMLLITGCKDKTEEDLIAKFEKKYNKFQILYSKRKYGNIK